MTDQEWFNSFKLSLKRVQICLDVAVPLIKNSGVLSSEDHMPDFFEFRQWVHDIRKITEIDPSVSTELIDEWFERIQNGSHRLDLEAERFDAQSKILTLFKQIKSDLDVSWALLDTGRGHFADRPDSSDIGKYLDFLESSFQSD